MTGLQTVQSTQQNGGGNEQPGVRGTLGKSLGEISECEEHGMDHTPIPHLAKPELLLYSTGQAVWFSPMSKHAHVHPPDQNRVLRIRLRKISGQIAAIERMIGEDRDCTDVLTQVVSVRKALKSFAEVIIQQHTRECIEHATDSKESQRRLRELLTVLKRYVE